MTANLIAATFLTLGAIALLWHALRLLRRRGMASTGCQCGGHGVDKS